MECKYYAFDDLSCEDEDYGDDLRIITFDLCLNRRLQLITSKLINFVRPTHFL